MARSPDSPTDATTPARWGWAAAVLLCLGLSGCAGLNLRGEKFKEDELYSLPQRFRPVTDPHDAFGVSNKALQIERNLGYN